VAPPLRGRVPRYGLALVLILTLAGCPLDDDDDADDDSAGDDDDNQTHALVATTDFTVGALATIDLDDWTVVDEITATTGDPVVQVHDGLVYQINRFQHDSVRVYDPPDFSTPLLEFSTGAGSNPQWVVPCAGALFVTRYESDSIGVFDPGTGLPLDEVDLSAFADADGLPEASSMIRLGDHLYAGLQRMDRDAGWQPDPEGGRVVEIDCVDRQVSRWWDTGANVMVHRVPDRDGEMLVVEGALFDLDYQMMLDGGIRELVLTDDAPGPLQLTEVELGGNIVAFAAGGGGVGLLALNVDEVHHLLCVDLVTWETTALWQTTSWIPEIQVNDRDQAFVPLRSGPADPGAPGGIAVIDLATCTDLTSGDLITFSLQPYSVGFF
jgi:hypothetical protein